MSQIKTQNIFMRCPMCEMVWQDRNIFLRDTSLEISGYQVDFDSLDMGLFLFTHKIDGCFSTLSVRAKEFYDLNPGKQYSQSRTLKDDCPTYCLYQDSLEECRAHCECAFVRDLLLIIQKIKFARP